VLSLSAASPDASKTTAACQKPVVTAVTTTTPSAEGLHQGVDQWLQGWRIKIAGASLDPEVYAASKGATKLFDGRTPEASWHQHSLHAALVREQHDDGGEGKGKGAASTIDSQQEPTISEAQAEEGHAAELAAVTGAVKTGSGSGRRFCRTCRSIHHYRSKCPPRTEPPALPQATDDPLAPAPDEPPCSMPSGETSASHAGDEDGGKERMPPTSKQECEPAEP